MPIPPAAFSPLTTTKSGACSSRSTGQQRRRARAGRRGRRRRRRTGSRCPAAIGRGTLSARARILAPRWRSCRTPPSLRPPASRTVVLPRWMQLVLLPLAILGLVAILRAAGVGAAAVHHRRADRAAAEPVRLAAAARALPARAGGGDRDAAWCAWSSGPGSCSPTRSSEQVGAFQRNVPGIVDDANASLADFQDWLDRNGIDVQVKEEGQTALQTLGRNVSEGSGELVSFTTEALQILVEASIALILDDRAQRLHAALRRADRPGRARDGAARRRDAGGRLPDAHPGRRVRLRARPVAVLADHGHERRRRCCGSSARSGSSPRARRTRWPSARSTASPS